MDDFDKVKRNFSEDLLSHGRALMRVPEKTSNAMNTNLTNQGWECPRCHQIHAPFVLCCTCPPPTTTHSNLGLYNTVKVGPPVQYMWTEPIETLSASVRDSFLDTRTMNALLSNNINTLGDILNQGRQGLEKLRNMGPKSIKKVIEFVEAYGHKLDLKTKK